jgi:hypothetical protein
MAAVLLTLAEVAWADWAKPQQKPFSHHFPTIYDHFSARATPRILKRIRRSIVFASLNTVKKWRKWQKWSVEAEDRSSESIGRRLL